MEVSLVLLRLYFSLAMFFGILVAYLLPFKLVQGRPKSRKDVVETDSNYSDASGEPSKQFNPKVLSYCNCISAGIFVAICFVGLFPVVREEFRSYFKEANLEHVDYPVAEFTILMGFFIVMFLEEFMMRCTNRSGPPVLQLDENVNEQAYRLLEDGAADGSSRKDDSTSTSRDSIEKPALLAEQAFNHSHDHTHHHHHHHHLDASAMNTSGVVFSVLIFATSIHSVFEGLALGLLSDIPRALHLFVGIIAHEVLVAFALGINSVKLNRTWAKNVQFGIIFSATVPLGILIGVAMGYTPGVFGKLISAVFQGFAAGTFLNVAFCELIPSELHDGDKYKKMFLILLGSLMMALLSLFHASHH